MTGGTLIARVREVGVMPILLPLSVDFVQKAGDALVAGGARGIEIVLRNDIAATALDRLRRRHPDLLIAAGTVLTPALYHRAAEAGADFCISPGTDPDMVALAAGGPLPLVPGVQTATEVLLARKAGLTLLKFYPAEPAGGTAVLADFANIYPDVHFMPSGRIGPDLLAAYAALSNIASVGGTWMFLDGGTPLPGAEMTRRMRDSLAAFREHRAAAGGNNRGEGR